MISLWLVKPLKFQVAGSTTVINDPTPQNSEASLVELYKTLMTKKERDETYQKLRNIYHRSIEFNSTSLTSNPILTFVALSGEVLLIPINARYSNYRNEHVRSSLTTG